MLSPFPPIADYAFVSDCHTGALIAPDGTVDWLCVPRFDSASVFGSLLDREAGQFRFGPFDSSYPAARRYLSGTNVVETTWRTRGGWAIVTDALTMGPAGEPDEASEHTRPPTDSDAEHLLVRTVECTKGSVEMELVCEPVFDYGNIPAKWSKVGDDRHTAVAEGADLTVRLTTDFALGIEGSAVRARHVLNEGERGFCALSWGHKLNAPKDVSEAVSCLNTILHYCVEAI